MYKLNHEVKLFNKVKESKVQIKKRIVPENKTSKRGYDPKQVNSKGEGKSPLLNLGTTSYCIEKRMEVISTQIQKCKKIYRIF